MSEQTNAAKFYGSAYTTARSEKLEKAVRYLDMAIRADTETKQEMAFNAALKQEAEAFA